MEWKERRAKEAAANQKALPKEEPKPVVKETKPAAPISNDAKKELQKLKTKFKNLEEQLEKLKANKTKLEAALADPDVYSDKQKFIEAEAAYKKADKELLDANVEYEVLFEKIMEM